MELNENVKKSKNTSLNFILILTMFVCSAFTGILPQTFLSVVIIACCVALFFTDSVYLAYPLMIFYNQLYGQLFGVSTYRLFSMIIIFSAVMKLNINNKIDVKKILPLMVYFFYSMTVLMDINVQQSIFSFIDIICSALIVGSTIQNDKEKLTSFFKVYAIVCFIAFFTGVIGGNTMVYDELENELVRFQATFEDPNYMGFFYTIGVFSVVTLRLFPKKARVVIIVLLYAIMMSSLSITALVINVALWIAYLLMFKKLRTRNFILLLVAMALMVGLYQFGVQNPDIPILGPLSGRIEEKLFQVQSGDISGATTGRTDLTAQHLEYFFDQPFWKQMIGGTSVNYMYIDPAVYGAAHNEYVDMLLNVGVFGAVILLGYILMRTMHVFVEFRRNKDDSSLCILVNKLIWFGYAASLTIFMDYRFLLPFFI